MDVIKQEFCHSLRIQNERNRLTGVRGNKTMNTLVPILHP